MHIPVNTPNSHLWLLYQNLGSNQALLDQGQGLTHSTVISGLLRDSRSHIAVLCVWCTALCMMSELVNYMCRASHPSVGEVIVTSISCSKNKLYTNKVAHTHNAQMLPLVTLSPAPSAHSNPHADTDTYDSASCSCAVHGPRPAQYTYIIFNQ